MSLIPPERQQFIKETDARIRAEGGDSIDVVQAVYGLQTREEAERFWKIMEAAVPEAPE